MRLNIEGIPPTFEGGRLNLSALSWAMDVEKAQHPKLDIDPLSCVRSSRLYVIYSRNV